MVKGLAQKDQYLSRRTFLTGVAKLGLAGTGLLLATTAGKIIPVSAAGASQDRWYHCWKCGSLFWAGPSGKACPAGGQHDLTNSWNFVLVTNDYPISGQDNWRHCWKCGTLFWAGPSGKACPAGGQHDPTNSWNLMLATEWSKISGGQDNWRHCWKCGTLFWAGLKGTVCPASGAHDPTNSWNFVLTTTPPTVISTPPPPPSISITPQGNQLYQIVGTNFIPGQDIYLRIVDDYGQGINNIYQHQWIGKAGDNGTINVSNIRVACTYNQNIHFSAHDERIDPAMPSFNLYSNIVSKTCQ